MLGLFEGQTSTLSVTAGPSKYAKNFGTTKWTSSKPGVVKVDKNGKITALKKGKATITAQVDSSKVKCVVTVYKKQESANSIVATSMSLSKTIVHLFFKKLKKEKRNMKENVEL